MLKPATLFRYTESKMTSQVPERLIYKGDEMNLHSMPDLPLDHPEINRLSVWKAQQMSSNCSRAYVGTWEVKSKKLYLNSLKGNYKLKGEPILADWFTGELSATVPGKAEYVHGGCRFDYEENLIITVVDGNVISIEVKTDTFRNVLIDMSTIRGINRTFGAIAEAAKCCFFEPQKNNLNNRLIVFIFEQKNVLEVMAGKILVAAQESKLPLPIGTCIRARSGEKINTDYILTVAIPQAWARELEKLFAHDGWGVDRSAVNNIENFWHLSVKDEQSALASCEVIFGTWGENIRF